MAWRASPTSAEGSAAAGFSEPTAREHASRPSGHHAKKYPRKIQRQSPHPCDGEHCKGETCRFYHDGQDCAHGNHCSFQSKGCPYVHPPRSHGVARPAAPQSDEPTDAKSVGDLIAIINKQAAELAAAKATIARQKAQNSAVKAINANYKAEIEGMGLFIDNEGLWSPFKAFMEGLSK